MNRIRHPEVLIAPIVTLAAVIGLLVVAGNYERLPWHPPECGFKTTLGIPCVGCGGTRSMQALAAGQVAEAASFNPAVVVGVFVSVAWAMAGGFRYWKGTPLRSIPDQNRLIKRNALLVGAILLLNWLYLLFFPP